MNNTSRSIGGSKQKRSEGLASQTKAANCKGEAGQLAALSNLASWAQRYNGFESEPKNYELKSDLRCSQEVCTDHWSGRDVNLHAVQPKDGGAFADATCSLLLSRARILQGCDHTHVVPIADYYLDDRTRVFWVTESRARKNLWQRLPKLAPDAQQTIDIISQFVSIVLWFEMQAPHVVPNIEPECLNIDEDGKLWLSDYHLDYLFDTRNCEPFPLIADFIEHLLSQTDVGKKKAELLAIAKKLHAKPVAKEVNSLNKLKAALRHIAERSMLAELSEEGT